ncbi:MAG TPA: hypothetical protein VHD35_18570 [Chitinophagaceae bacterium]|jgi:hypothetical protein|nr:hypothetical protein [Chitinophagaceae bacterium]
MKRFLFAIVIGSFLFACKDPKSANKEITAFIDTVDTSKGIHHADSLDLDNSPFITTNFPDTVQKVLYNDTDTLWNYVDSSFGRTGKKHKVFSKEKLNQVLINSGFTVDSTESQVLARKKSFNKRYGIEWLVNKSDTLTTQVQYWFKGKKYILINQKWNLQN